MPNPPDAKDGSLSLSFGEAVGEILRAESPNTVPGQPVLETFLENRKDVAGTPAKGETSVFPGALPKIWD